MNLERWDCICIVNDTEKTKLDMCVLWRLWWPTTPGWEDKTELYYVADEYWNVFTWPNKSTELVWSDEKFYNENDTLAMKWFYNVTISKKE